MRATFLAFQGLCLLFMVCASPLQLKLQSTRPVECFTGPVFWCQNLKTAKSCNAVTHCIQTVWEKQTYPVDNDSICKICLDMVKQARDQLLSNETQSDLKAVFEGTCHLIPIKKVEEECDKMADDFVPELVEALSSQMNPQVVCSVAGLCNNAYIDKLLSEQPTEGKINEPKGLTCQQCNKVSTLVSDKFKNTNRDTVLDNMMQFCGGLGTFSDACANIVLTYFNEIYKTLSQNLNSDSLCHLSGRCVGNFHKHEEAVDVEIIPDALTGYISPKDDDIPCDLCKQLVGHLRDLLVANTTESEFKTVLEGICKQTKSFKEECISIADQYYDVIYERLTNNLDPNGACFLIGICPKGLSEQPKTPFMPLLPTNTVQIQKKKLLGEGEPKLSVIEIQRAQLPKDVLLINPSQIKPFTAEKNTELCTICEYFLHFVQEALASPKNEEDIKRAVKQTCARLPKTVNSECESFVDNYGDAVIALLIQDIDPSQICPQLSLCAAVEKKSLNNEKCPLCLFVVQDAEELLKSDRSKENIRRVLNGMCSHLSESLKAECDDFVQTYTNELVDKLSSDFTPEQICLYLKLCTANQEYYIYSFGSKQTASELLTNSIADNTIDGIEIVTYESTSSPECILCQQLVKEVEKKVVKDKSKEHIKEELEKACEKFHKEGLKKKCIEIVEKNSDLIVDAIIKELTPKEICRELGLCLPAVQVPAAPQFPQSTEVEVKDGPQCVLCELIMTRLEAELKDKKTRDEIEKTVRNICNKLPKTVTKSCSKFIDQYGELIINLVDTVPPKQLCTEINLCVASHLGNIKRDEVIECAVCRAATDALAKFIEKEEIQNRDLIIQKTCNFLPSKYNHRCHEFMQSYVESLVNLINAGKLSQACEEIGMCYRNEHSGLVQIIDSSDSSESSESSETIKTRQQLVGANKCTYGPSYWCETDEQTHECNAHEFCATLRLKQRQASLP